MSTSIAKSITAPTIGARMNSGLSPCKQSSFIALNSSLGYKGKLQVKKGLIRNSDVTNQNMLSGGVVEMPKLNCRRSTMLRPTIVTQNVRAQAASGVNMAYEDDSIGLNALADTSQPSKFMEFITSERAKVVGMIAMMMAICNANRVVMSVAIVPLAGTHGWSSSFSGIVQSSFLWGYFFSAIPGGALADRYGGKIILAWGVAIWSLASLLTPWASGHSVGMLLAIRALFGLAEGVALPCMNIILSRWFPNTERATAVGLSMAGFHLGNVLSLLASPTLMSQAGVSGPFITFGLLGFLWLSIWVPSIYKDPQFHPRISKSELLYIQDGNESPSISTKTSTTQTAKRMPPFRLLFSKLPTWAIIVANITNNWGYFVLLSWMPVYFKTVFNVNLKQAAWFSAIPWATMAFAGYVAGACSDFLIESGYTITTVRKIMQSIGFLGPGLALLGLNAAQNPTIAAAWLTAGLSLSSFSQAGFLLNMHEIAPQYAGVLHGITNSLGTFAAIVSTIGTGYFVQWLGSFQCFLTLTAVLYFVSTIFWNLYATGERVFY
uniref:Major facilitator superfamily (MFS) profile domain-containing protein n=1 Tax=Araucaria cunninghamii TaxID=56994 RepID=A0A0D6R8C5_ARACU